MKALLFLLSLATQDRAPHEIQEGVYILRIGEKEMGRETVTFLKNGWRSKGTYDILGIQKGSYESFRIDENWGLTLEDRRGKRRYEARVREGKLVARALPDGKEKSLDTGGPFVYYVDLIWAHFIDIGRALVRDPKPGAAIPTIHPLRPVRFLIRLSEISKREGRWIFTIQLGPAEVVLVCAPDGLPLRILVPAQQVDVVLKGFEKVEPPGSRPTSIVDSGPWRKRLSRPRHTVDVKTKVMIPMRDRVRLAVDVYRPQAEGRFPAILVRTPYGRVQEGLLKGTYWARRGYALVAQDVRGRGESEGEWFPLRDEERDGYDTIEWLVKQPWCDGRIGMIGASYVGWVQWYAAKSGHPALKAIVPQVSPPDPLENFPYEGGVFLLSTAWWAKLLEAMRAREDVTKIDWIRKLAVLPLEDLDRSLDVKHRFVDEWLAHPPSDDKYWSPLRYQPHFDRMNVAALHISGWYDGDQPGATQNFPGMRRAGKKDQYLILGPWGHAFNMSRRLGEVDFGRQGMIDLDSVTLRFFDRYLKGVENEIDREDPVHVFVMGANEWRREKDWPLPGTRFTKVYLAGERANRRDGGGRLASEPAGGPSTYRYDPRETPKTLADFNDMLGHSATADFGTLPDRDDVLDFTSPPLAESLDLVGPFSATVWLTTDTEDTDVVVEILRLTQDGKLRIIAGGIQRLRYRKGKDEPVPPGTVARVTVDCWASGQRLEKGDRLRVQVSSNAFPGYARNMNTLEPQATAKTPKIATVRILHDAARPSHVLLPIVRGRLRPQR